MSDLKSCPVCGGKVETRNAFGHTMLQVVMTSAMRQQILCLKQLSTLTMYGTPAPSPSPCGERDQHGWFMPQSDDGKSALRDIHT